MTCLMDTQLTNDHYFTYWSFMDFSRSTVTIASVLAKASSTGSFLFESSIT